MNTDNLEHTELYATAGERLSHILDLIGFKDGRGRVTTFQAYLIEHQPEAFADLKYTTVRSWFQEHAPPMRKMDSIFNAISKEHVLHHDISQIKIWWKAGGYYPFVDVFNDSKPSLISLQNIVKENQEKLQFIVMSLVTEETGELFNSLTSEDLISIKESALRLATDFADPLKTECPKEYLRIMINGRLQETMRNKPTLSNDK